MIITHPLMDESFSVLLIESHSYEKKTKKKKKERQNPLSVCTPDYLCIVSHK